MNAVDLATKGRISGAAETVATMGRIAKVRGIIDRIIGFIRVTVQRGRFRTTVKR